MIDDQCASQKVHALHIPQEEIMRLLKPALAALAIAIATPALAQVPRTSDGKPDLNGAWSNASLTPLTRDPAQKSLVVSEAEATKIAKGTALAGIAADDPEFSNAGYSDPNKGAPEKGGDDFGLKGYDKFWVAPGDKLAQVKGEWRTSNIIEPANGQLPYRHPEEQAKRDLEGFRRYATGAAPYEGPEEPTLSERCLIGFGQTGGPGMLSVLYNNNYQFVQTPDHMMILVEMAHDARIVPIFKTAEEARNHHKPNVIKPWLGDTVGWWDGDTFLMETSNVNPQQMLDQSFPLSANGVVTEKLTRISDKEVFYQFEVNDPDTYTQTWKAELSFYPATRVYEYACHEGNQGMIGILAGARELERAKAAEATKKQPTKVKATKAKRR
jgi:hypothetical protein